VELFTGAPESRFDAILMDVMMPVMNGYEATKAIRASDHPEAKTIPIIAMTANAYIEDVQAALDAGMNAHVAKPIDFKELFSTLGHYRKEKGL
jgi:CheY-like chemotaxis protein